MSQTVRLTKGHVFRLYQLVRSKFLTLSTQDAGVKTIYKVAKLHDILKSEAETIRKAISAINVMLAEYENERQRICTKYAKRDENGNPITEAGQYVIEDKEAFEKEIKQLKERYKDQLESAKKANEELDQLLEEEIELAVPKIELSELPDKVQLTTLEFELLLPIVQEE